MEGRAGKTVWEFAAAFSKVDRQARRLLMPSMRVDRKSPFASCAVAKGSARTAVGHRERDFALRAMPLGFAQNENWVNFWEPLT